MTHTVVTDAQSYHFDDRNLRWRKLGDFEHFVLAMYDLDPKRKVVDFILKFVPNERIFLHRHLALTNTLVIQGEHRLYEPGGRLKEIRQVGSYTSSAPGEPHHEGGGSDGAVVFYSVRAEGDELFDVLDDSGNLTGKLMMQDFAELLKASKER